MNNKKITTVFFLVLLFFAGIIPLSGQVNAGGRWFRSNAGGMALEETHSRLVAMRSEYALGIFSAGRQQLPDYLIPHYNERYSIEYRMLFKNRELLRTQWLFRDTNGRTRLNAVIFEPEEPEESQESDEGKHITGFIEIFDQRSLLTSEYRFFEDGRISRIDYTYNNNQLISATVWLSEDGEEYTREFVDFYRYNRSLSLLSIERTFYREIQISDSVLIAFPRHIMDAVNENFLSGGRTNLFPDFFGEVFAHIDSRIIYETDERGRILTQTLYDDEDNILWIIRNTWQGNRIVSTAKTEEGVTLLAEYEFNSAGDRTLERNYRNGVIERTVRAEGGFDIEELYLDNVVVLRAVWEDGRKISETRVRN